jgi:predicted RNase H-like nuclease
MPGKRRGGPNETVDDRNVSIKDQYLGIDGCPDGWFCVQLGPGTNWDVSVCPVDEVSRLGRSAKTILIDIPIGLVDSGVKERACDKEARRALGPKRGPSVFPVPARETLDASTYQRALAINRRIVGRGISVQSWGIAPKIKVIDGLLRTDATLRRKIRESHPEVCFWALNGARPMQHKKTTAEGRAERMTLLRRFLPAADAMFERATENYLRKQVARDDIIDAMVLAVTAKFGDRRYCTFPASPPRDAYGLPMEMCFYAK